MQICCLAVVSAALALAGTSWAGTAIHIAPDGKDDAPGTAAAPIRTLGRLQALLSAPSDIAEVVFHRGIYSGSLWVPVPKNLSGKPAAEIPPLVLRAADGEEAVLDGARRLEKAEPVAGSPGVYEVKDPVEFRSEAQRKKGLVPSMWDAAARKHYALVADLQAVCRFPASYVFTADRLFVHTTDGRPPAEHSIEVSRLDVNSFGLDVYRPNVTVRGLACRSFQASYTYSAGIAVHGDNVTVEDCRAFNCSRGFLLRALNTRLLRCRADDCGGGVLVNSRQTLIEDCRFFRPRDEFMMPMPLQEDTGIEVYWPAGERVVMRRNVCKGFTFCGVFLKCDPGEFVIENNTFVECGAGLSYYPSPGKIAVCRDNIVYGCKVAIAQADAVTTRLKASNNCVWPAPSGDAKPMAACVKYLNTVGEGNQLADPRMAAPERDDFRLLADSPCLARGAEGSNIGALGTVPSDFKLPGNSTEPAVVPVPPRTEKPVIADRPVIRANRFGVVISFETNVECVATGEFGPDKKYGTPLRAADEKTVRRVHVFGALPPNPDPDKPRYYRIRIENDKGETAQVVEGELRLRGDAKEFFVAADGQDAETRGSADAPWRSLQYAVDRALPGDCVTLRSGLYAEPTLITRGGIAGAPLTVRAEKKWAVVLDGHRRVRNLIRVAGAPYVEIVGMELRWFGDPEGEAIRIERSPHVAVRECKIWNAFWHESRAVGVAIRAADSPGFVMEKNLIFRDDSALDLVRSPNSRIVYNTVRGLVHGGLYFDESVAGTVLRDNSLTFEGNYALQISVADPKEMETFDSDYNNLGTSVRHWRNDPGAVPNLPAQWGDSKTVALFIRKGGTWHGTGHLESQGSGAPPVTLGFPQSDEGWEGQGPTRRKWIPNAGVPPDKRGIPYWRPETFEDWKAFSGKDAHSIYAEPRPHNLLAFDFRLDPNSPEISAGENGSTIGAMEVCRPEAR